MADRRSDFELILAAITDGIVVVDQRGIVLYANASAEQIFERGDLMGRDLAIPLASGGSYQDINLIRRSGIGWAELRSSPIIWKDQAAHVIGVRDITERKNTELGLRQAAAVFDSTHEGLVMTDTHSRIVRVNPAFTTITGYTSDEVLGKTPAVLKSGRHDAAFYVTMWQSIADLGHWQGEIWNRRKDGAVYPQLASISAVKDADGQVRNYVAVFADISSLKKVQADLAYLAHHDPLTELPNRLSLQALLLHRLQSAKLHGGLLALLMIDLDRFKDVNDSYGHPVGDELLKQVAARLCGLSGQADMVCRFGGDEFTLLLEHMHHAEEAGKMANDVICSLSEPYCLNSGVEVRIGASVGISIYPDHGDTPEMLLQQADSALSKAKSEGRNRFMYFSENLTRAARERIDIEVRLRHAITHGELRVYYQPQVDIESGLIMGAEALVRWQSPTEGLIQPVRFIPIAEVSGLIGAIDDWVLRQTCEQGQRWVAAGLPPLTLAVNLSPYQFLQGDISATVKQVLQDTGYAPQNLELELTESALMQHEDEAILILHQLRAMGLKLAIDDFGTGYSSLAYLKLFPLNVLKIDKRFIDDIPLHRDDMEIVTAIVAVAHALGLKVLAEGVENTSQLAYLKQQGCNYFQGYLTSRPVPADEFEQLLRHQPA